MTRFYPRTVTIDQDKLPLIKNLATFMEEIYQQAYKDYHEANLAQFSYIEGFYNSRRIISVDGYLTPDEKE